MQAPVPPSLARIASKPRVGYAKIYGMAATQLGALIRMRRDHLGLTAQEVGDAVGLSRSGIEAIENGRTRNPSPDVMRGLSDLLGISRVELLVAAGYLDEAEASPLIQLHETLAALREIQEANQRLERLWRRPEPAR